MDSNNNFFKPGNILKLVLIAAGTLVFGCVLSVYVPQSFTAGEKKQVYINYGTGFKKVSNMLGNGGIVRNRFVFDLYLMAGAKYKKLRAGEYEFGGNENMAAVAMKMIKGDVLKHEITITEGSDIYDIADMLETEKLMAKDRFLALVKDKAFLQKIGIRYDTAEGLLFPDTYDFIRGETEEKIIGTMFKRFIEKAPVQLNKIYSVAGKSYSGYEILKMASIIEKEARLDNERELVSSVFYNRLNADKRLESCATVRYAMNKKRGPITNDDLQFKSVCNTYRHRGLPPVPICCPGIKSMIAAMKPAETNYMFFVVKEDGSHTFSEDFQQHIKAKLHNRKKYKNH